MSDEKQGGVFKDVFLSRSVRGSLKIQKAESTPEVKPSEVAAPVETAKIVAAPAAEKAVEETTPIASTVVATPTVEKTSDEQKPVEAAKPVDAVKPVDAAVAMPEVKTEAKSA